MKRRTRVAEPWKTVVYHHYPKLGVVCDSDDHFILAFRAGRGPRPDVDEFRPLVAEALRLVRLSLLTADAGYDSEPNHEFARDEHGVRTVIPAKLGRPTDKPPTGRYRRLMKSRFDRAAYRRRTQVETVISMIKRRQGAHVRGRSHHSRCRDLRLLALVHNVMILVLIEVFYRACRTPNIIRTGARDMQSHDMRRARCFAALRRHLESQTIVRRTFVDVDLRLHAIFIRTCARGLVVSANEDCNVAVAAHVDRVPRPLSARVEHEAPARRDELGLPDMPGESLPLLRSVVSEL